MRREAIIFDFDGVLADSEPTHELAVARVCQEQGWPIEIDAFHERFVGKGDRNVFRVLSAEAGLALTESAIGELCDAKRAAFRAIVDETPPPSPPGAVELVRAAADACPGRVAVCTGSRRREVEPLLERMGYAEFVADLITADDVAETKPDPACYRLSCERVGVAPAMAAAIEDSPTGIAAAVAAGLRTFAVAHSFALAKLERAHVRVDRIAELTVESLLAE